VQEVAPGAIIFHAGTKLVGDETVTDGGRVLAATALGKNMAATRAVAYDAVEVIKLGKNTAYRKDIAQGV
ncbi:MAG: phosphoribosylglycinamide synthetase C domain-containing protein, partial [Patescibacteria group bacterium]